MRRHWLDSAARPHATWRGWRGGRARVLWRFDAMRRTATLPLIVVRIWSSSAAWLDSWLSQGSWRPLESVGFHERPH